MFKNYCFNMNKINQFIMDYQPNFNFSFKCFGNPGFYYEDEKELINNDDDKIKFYTLDKLPGNVLIIQIIQGALEYIMSTTNITKEDLEKLIDAQTNNTNYIITVRPGSNQETSIKTNKGYTYFKQWGSGGDSPTDSYIKIPNDYCVKEFQHLINY